MRFYKSLLLLIPLLSLMACQSLPGVRFVADREVETSGSAKNSTAEQSTAKQSTAEQSSERSGDGVAPSEGGVMGAVSAWFTRPERSSVRSAFKGGRAVKSQFHAALEAMKLGQNAKAEALFLALTDDHPELFGPWFNLGLVYRASGRLDDASRALKNALEINGDNINAYNQLAIVSREQGQFERAEELYLAALNRWPDHPGSHRNLGILYELYTGQLIKALQHYEHYLQLVDGVGAPEKYWVVDLKRRL